MEENLQALKDLDVTVIAASVDDEDKAAEIAADLSFPIAHGVTRAQADSLGAYWEDRRGIVQPSEFFLGPDHKVIYNMYGSGPVGRMNPPDIVNMIGFVDKQRKGG
ncbi:MAG: redoxin domain-containing protein [Rhodospirillaceae bacterium]|jgi:peroxiredoxin|nr:redoxin domain-containing protein [Rhodospirillaceae bacterium]MBT5192018.1 redoxin domain-containing protein [Rhodospirillaceae bacterium]MBT5896375.1 redoxin domain-containing protein [Rhodospirillaceae bacterium]MBT6426037.1 redoxin domain-containing protein [Rhodospirillaceae bacterium]MBT7760236.1 redoxin domain-containing protein [Rhodospirillaceae bacterium]